MSFGGIVIYINDFKKENSKAGHYNTIHAIHQNSYLKPKNEIKEITESFVKDTILENNLKYAIIVSPYAGI